MSSKLHRQIAHYQANQQFVRGEASLVRVETGGRQSSSRGCYPLPTGDRHVHRTGERWTSALVAYLLAVETLAGASAPSSPRTFKGFMPFVMRMTQRRWGYSCLAEKAQPPSAPDSKFIHVDMDSYFVAVELLDAPWLRDRPVAVGGRAIDRGVISTSNYIARQFGVRSGMATATAQRLCPELVLLPVRFERYEAVTRRLDSIFRRYDPNVEFLSLDEATLDVTGQVHCNGSATLMALQIRKAVEQELKLTASAGIAPLKYLAKMASEVNKPNGQFVVKPDQVQSFLANMDVRKIPEGRAQDLGCSAGHGLHQMC